MANLWTQILGVSKTKEGWEETGPGASTPYLHLLVHSGTDLRGVWESKLDSNIHVVVDLCCWGWNICCWAVTDWVGVLHSWTWPLLLVLSTSLLLIGVELVKYSLPCLCSLDIPIRWLPLQAFVVLGGEKRGPVLLLRICCASEL